MAYVIEVQRGDKGWEWEGEANDKMDAIAMATTTAKGSPWRVRWEGDPTVVASSQGGGNA